MAELWETLGWTDEDKRDNAINRVIGGLMRAKSVTAAELKVVTCLSHGLTVSEAAVVLGVSEHTTRTQVKTARARMGAKTNAHLVARAMREGLIK